MMPVTSGTVIRFRYTNHRGETAQRHARFFSFGFGTTEYYQTPQWLMRALDLDRNLERTFAMAQMTDVTLD